MSLTARPQARRGLIKAAWLAATGLLLLGMLPIIAGAFRLSQLSGVSDVMRANPHYAAVPLPVVLHIVGATVLAILGPLQFVAGFRRRWPAWHRVVSIVLGLGAIRRSDVQGHRQWMSRGYATGLGATTQMLTLMVASGTGFKSMLVNASETLPLDDRRKIAAAGQRGDERFGAGTFPGRRATSARTYTRVRVVERKPCRCSAMARLSSSAPLM